jgi:PPOX class probable F420-dependent enzyme
MTSPLLTADGLQFVTERHLATLSTMGPAGSIHVVAVGFSYAPAERLVRVITFAPSVKARNAGRPGAVAAICQVDGARWLTVSGPIRVATDGEAIADAVARYAARYRQPRVNPERVALIIEVETMMGTSRFG